MLAKFIILLSKTSCGSFSVRNTNLQAKICLQNLLFSHPKLFAKF